MSVNQSRAEKSEASQYKKSGRSGSFGQQRSFSGGSGKGGGGGTAPPPSASSLSSSRSFKKPYNAQGGAPRAGSTAVISDSNSASARTEQNGIHVQSPLHGSSDAPSTGTTVKPAVVSTQKSAGVIPKPPSSNVHTAGSNTKAPTTPAKGDASRPFPLQFGSINPGFMNGMQVPARTSSAPPNLDEQKRDQARHESLRAVPPSSIPSIPKQQLPRKDAGNSEHSDSGEAHPMPKVKNDIHVSAATPVTQIQKPSVHPVPGIPMQMPFHQPQVQFSGPTPQMQSQTMAPTSLQMPMQLPLPMGNPSQVQQQVFIPGLPPHPIQSQGMMHQGQGLNFSSQMGPQLGPQLGNLGMGITPQFSQQQTGKFVVPRKTVKITHPKTHEELNFEKRSDSHVDSGSSGPRAHPSVTPQSQPISSFPSTHPLNYYHNVYPPGPMFFPAASSVPISSNQITPTSQASRFFNQVPPVSQTVPFINPSSTLPPYPVNKSGGAVHTLSEPSLEHSRDVQTTFTSSSSVQVTVKPAAGSHKEENAKSSSSGIPRDHATSSQRISTSVHVSSKPNEVDSGTARSLGPNTLSSHPVPSGDSTLPSTASTEVTKVVYRSSESISDEHIKTSSEDLPLPQNQLEDKTATVISQSSQALEHSDSLSSQTPEALEGKITPPSDITVVALENTRDSEPNVDIVSSDASDLKTNDADKGNVESPEVFDAGATVDEQSKLQTVEGKEQEEIVSPMEMESKQEEGSSLISPGSTSLESAEVAERAEHTKVEEPVTDLASTTSDVTNVEGDESSGKEVADTESAVIDQEPVSSLPEPNKAVEREVADSVNTNLVSPSALTSKDKPLVEPNKGKNALSKSKKKKREMLQRADAAGMTSDLYMAYKGPEEKKETIPSTESVESISSIKQGPADASHGEVISSEKGDLSNAEPDDWEDAEISSPTLETSGSEKQIHGGLERQTDDENEVNAKKYSRDFLMTFKEKYVGLPEGFEIPSDIADILTVSNVNITPESYPSPGRVIDRPMGVPRLDRRGSMIGEEDKWSNKMTGLVGLGRDMRLDVGYGGNVAGFRPQGGNHGVLRNSRVQSPVAYASGILSGPMQSLGPHGGPRNNSDSDRWQRATGFQKGLMPSPQTPHQVMHRAERKYEVGKITDEEQAKQRVLKGILNKLTPQNFEKLFDQVKAVNIDNAVTLTGVISQIFDKALMEPTFCEMYADFCYHLSGELPDLSVDNEKITFKRLLLNKCQEEFEKGIREQEEADKAEEEGEVKQSAEEREEKRTKARRRMLGNIRLIGELCKKKMLTEKIMHECIKTLLGQPENPNEEDLEALCKLMSTIGELLDHNKAKPFMDAYFDMMANLSNNMKLSSRVRFMLKDAIDLRKNKWQQRRKVEGPKKIEEVHRDAVQERQAQVGRLSRAPSLSTSGRRGQSSMDYAPRGSMMSSPSSQMGGFHTPSPQLRGYGAQDARYEDRHSYENKILPQRSMGDDPVTLGPQGGLSRGISLRPQPSGPSISMVDRPSSGDSRRMGAGLNGYGSVQERTAYGSREDMILRHIPDRNVSQSAFDQSSTAGRSMNYGIRDTGNADRKADRYLASSPPTKTREPPSVQNVSSEKVWPEEKLREKSKAAIEEFYSVEDEKEIALCIKELNSPSFYPSMISMWVNDSFERKEKEREILAKLLSDLTKSRDVMISRDQLMKGFESVLSTLEDTITDAPRAAEFLGRIFGKVIVENVVQLSEIGRLIQVGGEEEGRLVEMGLAADLLGTVLEMIKAERGDTVFHDICKTSNLHLHDFRPSRSNKTWRLDKFIS